MADQSIRRLLLGQCNAFGLSVIDPKLIRHIVYAVRGRVGWLTDCVRRLQMPEYWHGGCLHVSGLRTDTEIEIRKRIRGPRMCGRSIRARTGN